MHAAFILGFRFLSLSRGPFKDLEVDTSDSPPGTQCCFYALFMSLNQGKPQRLFGLDVGPDDAWRGAVGDFGGTGRREIMGADARMYPFSSLCYEASPPLYTVVGWDGAHWTDVTKRYPRPVLRKAAEIQDQLVRRLRGTDDVTTRDWTRSAAAAYLANTMKAGGDSAGAIRWLRRRLPKVDWDWLQASLPELRTQVWLSTRDVHSGAGAPSAPVTGLATFSIPARFRR